jgi:hypothetical protein
MKNKFEAGEVIYTGEKFTGKLESFRLPLYINF